MAGGSSLVGYKVSFEGFISHLLDFNALNATYNQYKSAVPSVASFDISAVQIVFNAQPQIQIVYIRSFSGKELE